MCGILLQRREYVTEEEDEAATASNDRSTANFILCLDPALHIKDLSR